MGVALTSLYLNPKSDYKSRVEPNLTFFCAYDYKYYRYLLASSSGCSIS